MSMSKLTCKRAQCSTSSCGGEGEGSPRHAKRRRQALLSCVLNSIKEDIKQEIRSVVTQTVREVVKEELQKMNSQIAKPLERAPSRPIERGDSRNLQLHFKTRLSIPLYTEEQIKGENDAPIHIALIDANTGSVESGPWTSIKLDVVALDGDFMKDNSNDWTREDFEKYEMREREGKAPLLIGDLQVTLEGGVGVLGKLKFTDNSSWNRSKMYMIGLKVASGYCEGVRIREAITEAIRVKDHRGKPNEKHYPPKPDDDVWRLEKIAKGGPYYKRLIENGIANVEDLLWQFVRDPKILRNMLGGGMTDNKWHGLIDHAKSCVQSGKLYVYSCDELSEGVVFDIMGQLKGFIADGSFLSADSISHELKEKLNNLVRRAYNDWDHVKDFNNANYPMQNSASATSPAGAFRGQQDYLHLSDCHLTSFNTPVPSECPPGCSGMLVEDQVEVPVHQSSALTEPPSAPPTLHGCSTSSVYLHEGQGSMEKLLSTSVQDDHGTESFMFDSDLDNLIRSFLEDDADPILPSRSTSRAAVVSWLRIKAVFRWGFFVRRKVTNKGRPTIMQLN